MQEKNIVMTNNEKASGLPGLNPYFPSQKFPKLNIWNVCNLGVPGPFRRPVSAPFSHLGA